MEKTIQTVDLQDHLDSRPYPLPFILCGPWVSICVERVLVQISVLGRKIFWNANQLHRHKASLLKDGRMWKCTLLLHPYIIILSSRKVTTHWSPSALALLSCTVLITFTCWEYHLLVVYSVPLFNRTSILMKKGTITEDHANIKMTFSTLFGITLSICCYVVGQRKPLPRL